MHVVDREELNRSADIVRPVNGRWSVGDPGLAIWLTKFGQLHSQLLDTFRAALNDYLESNHLVACSKDFYFMSVPDGVLRLVRIIQIASLNLLTVIDRPDVPSSFRSHDRQRQVCKKQQCGQASHFRDDHEKDSPGKR